MHEDWGEFDLGVDIDTEGNPPRVWCMDHDYPGTAFSSCSTGNPANLDVAACCNDRSAAGNLLTHCIM